MRRFLLVFFGLVLLVVVGGGILLTLLLDEDNILELAATTLKEQTGATLTVAGDKKLSLFPTLGVTLGDAAITLPDKTEPDLTVGSLDIGVRMLPLLSREVVIDTFKLDGLNARIEQAPAEDKLDTGKLTDAQLDAFYQQRREEREAAGKAAGAEAALAIPLALNVGRLEITDATVQLVDTATGEQTRVSLNRLRASGLNLAGDAIPVELEAQLAGEQPITVNLNGEFTVNLDQQQARIDGMEVKVTGATAAPLEATVSGPVDLARQAADLAVELTLGDTRGSGKLRYASFESPQIFADLALNLFDPALLVLAGPGAAEATPEETTPASGDEPLPLDALRTIDTEAKLAIEQARFGAHVIENASTTVRVVNGVAAVSNLTGTLHGGQILVNALFNGKHNIATLAAKGSVKELDIAAALAASEVAAQVTGTASLTLDLISRGSTANELTEALAGPIRLTTDQVVLEGTSVEHLLCQAVALTNQERLTAQFPPRTAFTALSADIQMGQGKAVIKPLTASLQHIGLAGQGSFELLSQDFSATIAARVSPGLEELDRACRVSKRLADIEFPVRCKGNMAEDPAGWCHVETEEILKDLATSEAKRKIEKEAGKLFDKLLNK